MPRGRPGRRDVGRVRFTGYKNARVRVPLGDVGAGRGRRRGDRDGAEGGDGGHDVCSQSVCADLARAVSPSVEFSEDRSVYDYETLRFAAVL